MLKLLKPTCLESVFYNERIHCKRSLYFTTKSSPLCQQLEKAHAKQKRPSTAKKKKLLKKKVKEEPLMRVKEGSQKVKIQHTPY